MRYASHDFDLPRSDTAISDSAVFAPAPQIAPALAGRGDRDAPRAIRESPPRKNRKCLRAGARVDACAAMGERNFSGAGACDLRERLFPFAR